MARTIAVVQAELDTVNAAITEITSGNRVTQLTVGSAEFQRTYKHQEVSLDKLLDLRKDLMNELLTLTPSAEPTFRSFGSIPLVIGKAGITGGCR